MLDNSSSYVPSQTVISLKRDPNDPQSQPMTALTSGEPFYIVAARPSNLIADDPPTISVTIEAKDGSSAWLTLKDTGIVLENRHIYSTDRPVALSQDGAGGQDPVPGTFEGPAGGIERLPVTGQGEITISYKDGSAVAHITVTASDQPEHTAPGASTEAAVEPPTQPIRVKPLAAEADLPTQPIKVKPPAAIVEPSFSPTRQAGYTRKLIESLNSVQSPPVDPFTGPIKPYQVTAEAPPQEGKAQEKVDPEQQDEETGEKMFEKDARTPAAIPVTGAVEGQMALPPAVKPDAGALAGAQTQARLLNGLLLAATVFLTCVTLAYIVYNFGANPGFLGGGHPPAAIVAAAPVDGTKAASGVQPPAGVTANSTQADTATPLPAAVTPIPTQADAATTMPQATSMPQATTMPQAAVVKAPPTVLVFDQARLDSFNVQLADLVVLDPQTTWGKINNYRNLADWATAGTAQALSAAGEQLFFGAGFRSQNTSKGTALVTSTVHEFASLDAAQKGVQIMAADVKTTLTNALEMQASATLRGGATAPVVLVTGSQGTGTYVFFIARYNNMVVDVTASGFDSSSTGLNALVKDCKTLGQQMLNQIAGAAPVQ